LVTIDLIKDNKILPKQRKGTFDINISKAHLFTFRKVEKSLPCAKGGGTACRDGGIVKDWFFAQNNPSVASRQLPLHKGAFDLCGPFA